MNTIQELYQQAQLSEAAYATFLDSAGNLLTNSEDIKTALIASKFSATQASDFVTQWRVVHQYTAPVNALGFGGTGFSGTVFERLDDAGNGTGQFTFALRGTEPGYADLTEDVGNIVVDGMAWEQAIEMYNYWQRLTHTGVYEAVVAETRWDLTAAYALALTGQFIPAFGMPADAFLAYINTRTDLLIDNGGLIVQLEMKSSITAYENDDDRQWGLGQEEIALGSLNVTGHSLGGHLAAAFIRLFPGLDTTAITVNGAGFPTGVIPGLGLNAQTNIVHFFEFLGGAAQFNPNAIMNVHGDGLDFVTMNSQFGLVQQGSHLEIYIENMDPVTNTLGHGSPQMTNSLAVLSILDEIDSSSTLSLSTASQILEAATNKTDQSFEQVINDLAKLFGVAPISDLDANSTTDGREALYQKIHAIREEIDLFQPMTVEGLTGLNTNELVILAEDSIAYRYALVNLNPFVISGNDALYTQHNQDHALDLYNPATGLGLTPEYIEARASYLQLVIERNLNDYTNDHGYASTKTSLTSESRLYHDYENNIIIAPDDNSLINRPDLNNPLIQRVIFGFNNETPDLLIGGDRDDHLFGQKGNDVLIGGKGMDYLEGGAGNDTLYSGSLVNGQHVDDHTPDILVGGEGFDTYYAGLNDIIRDSDGQGEIRINGEIIPLSNITLESGTTDLYTNNDPDNPVRFRQLANGSLQLIGSFITVEGFSNGDFGINLDPNITTPGLNYIEGTEFDDRAGSTDPEVIGGGIGGTEGADEIHGLGGDDDIDGFEGDDVIFGGDGDDLLIGGFGHDVLEGGDGRDVILSGIGKDVLLGGAGDDFLSGFDDDDFLDGGDGHDFLAGGLGSDTLLGGIGDDVLMGDGVYFAFDSNWQVIVTDTTPGAPGGAVVSFNESITGTANSEDDRADVLDGGAGNDVLFGGGGNDQLFGGEGHDSLIGGDGDDTLDGGEGDDYLEGDDNNDPDATGHDTLFGGAGNDILDGGAGDDFLSGGAGNDQLKSGAGNDELYGDDGDDMIFGHAGDDFADGGAGNDQIDGGDGNDTLLGGAGNDLIRGGTGYDFIDGGDGDDQIFGDDDDDTLHGGAGMDTLLGGAGNDILFGGLDNDVLAGGAGDDKLHGDAGDDQLQGGEGNDILHGGDGNDVLFGEAGDDQLFGDAGDDQLIGGIGHDLLDGGDDVDFLWGGDGDDILRGGAGNDSLFGEAGNDQLEGGEGDDVLIGGAGHDVLEGGAGQDELQGGEGDDVLSGGAGHDVLFGEGGNDTLSGGSGNDTLIGGAGFDVLSGGDGHDELQGGSDNDLLMGGAGDDRLFGNDGNDSLHGGMGDDLLVGDAGNDMYLFNIGDGKDTIIEQGDTLGDFIQLGNDIIPDETFITRENNNLIITHAQDYSDRLTVANWFGSAVNKLDRIVFNDGTIWDQGTIEARVNFAPIANPDIVSGYEDSAIIISAATLTANDTDPENDTLYIFQVDNPVNGTVILNQDGDVIFTPVADFVGNAFFDYTVTDSRGGFDTQTVTVNVININDAPQAQPDTAVLTLKPTDTTIPPDGEPVLTGGDEFLVNTTTQNRQDNTAITSLATGGYVVIWSGNSNAGDNTGIAGQLFDGLGNKAGTEFLVNTLTSFGQSQPDVTALTGGGFVVVWETQDAASGDSTTGIAGQRFDSAGNKIGTEFLVNTDTTDLQVQPSTVSLSNGGFIVTWVNYAPVSGVILSAQLFDVGGNKAGGEFLVNTTPVFQSSRPVAAGLPNGNFIIAWNGEGPNANGFTDIIYKMYAANGFPIGGEVLVNTNNFRSQSDPDITVLQNGNFVITWQGADPATGDNSGNAVSGQLFSMIGNKIGSEFLVNTTLLNEQLNASVVGLTDGSFVVIWENTNFSNISEICGQQFDATGIKIGNEFKVNQFDASSQLDPDVTALTDGGFAVTWASADPAIGDPNGSTGGSSNLGIAGRVYRYIIPAATDNTISVNVLANDLDVDDNVLTFSLDTVTLQGSRGVASIVNNQLHYDAGADFEFLDEGDTDTVVIDYTMSDDDGATSSLSATITVIGVNDLPFVEGEIPDQVTNEDSFFNFTFSSGIFSDPDADESLTFTAALSNGNALPTWLSFDPNTLTFSGTPLNDDVGTVVIRVTATDSFSESATTPFLLTANNTNDQPFVNAPLNDQFINAATPYIFTVPSNTFIDVDVGDLLTYSATLLNGGPLPDWLTFEPQTQLFSGTPANGNRGIVSIRVQVVDNQGAIISDSFELTVNAVPELRPDRFITLVDTDVFITASDLLSNDNDPDGDPLTISNIKNEVNGSINITFEGNIIFTPTPGFNGIAGFDYTVADGRGGFSTQNVIVKVLNPVTGDSGDNILNGTSGDDLLDGRAGNDTLNGIAGNDVLIGGQGNDLLNGGSGSDTYLFGRSDGNDIILESDSAEGGDILRFADDIAFADVQVQLNRKDLVLTLKDTGDSITLQQWKSGKNAYPIAVEFGDGTALTADDLNVKFKLGDNGNDTLRGSRFNDYLYGLAGNDRIIAKDGDDIIDGGTGNDTLESGAGNDTYQFTRDWGNDTIIENDATPGNTDTVAFGSGLGPLDLQFERMLNDLRISLIGSNDNITVQNWYLGSQYQTEIFQASDGNALLNIQVDQLIQAMAGFSVESGLDWTNAVQQRPEEVETILASSWQPAA